MITPEQAEKIVEWAEENGIPFSSLISPHITLWVIVLIFIVLVIGTL